MAEALLARGVAPSSVAKELRHRLDLPRNEAYQLVQELAAE
jgi:DNA-binding IclR family transcriptional regulator